MNGDEYTVQETVVEYDTGWYRGGFDRVEQPDGSTKKYYWAALPDAVAVVAVTPDDQLVFVEQYRPAAQNTFCGCPTGMVDAGESYTEAAARELREETGYVADELHVLTEVSVATGVLRHTRGIVVATGVTQSASQSLDDNEYLTVQTLPVPEAVASLWDAPIGEETMTALLAAREHDYI